MTHRILVVDDEPDITALVAYHLAKAGFRVSTASNGPDALKAAREERPDIVILDLMLPGRVRLRRAGRAAPAGGDPGRRRHPAHRPARGDRPDPRALARRRRLSHQAVLAPGALAPGARPAPAAGLAAGDRRLDPRAPARSPSTARPTARASAAQELNLTATEYKLLLTLVERRGRVQTRPAAAGDRVGGAARHPDPHGGHARAAAPHQAGRRRQADRDGARLRLPLPRHRARGARAVSFARRLVLGTVAHPRSSRCWSCSGAPSARSGAISRATSPRSLESEARLVREALPADSLGWDAAVHRLSRAEQPPHHPDRPRPAGSGPTATSRRARCPPIENHAGRPEVRRGARRAARRAPTRRSETVGRQLHVRRGARRARRRPGGGRTWTRWTRSSRRAQRRWPARRCSPCWSAAVLALVAGRSIARPLTEIAAAARAIAAGAPPRFPRSGIPDIDVLVQALRQMHRQLGDRFDELRREQAEIGGAGRIDGRGRDRGGRAGPDRHRQSGRAAAARLRRRRSRCPTCRSCSGSRPRARWWTPCSRASRCRTGELEMDGRVFLVNARPLPAGGAVLVLHDLTEMRRLEAVRRDFVANVSHELKTPLTSISGYAETLLGDTRRPRDHAPVSRAPS